MNPNSSNPNPVYYRWVFDPVMGTVSLYHNEEDHPATVQYHSEIGQGDNDRGYAYRIGGGWRITDWEHEAVWDKFIINRVLEALSEAEGEGFTFDKSPKFRYDEELQ